jgi:putative Holliday junction resolvase
VITGTVLAFDFGLRRIGVAVGELAHGIGHPLDTIAFEDNARRMEAIAALVREWQPVRLIVGRPSRDDGGPHPLQAPIARFVGRLRARFGIEVETVDERLSSWAASRTLSQAGVPAAKQKRIIDSMAACAILETWFEARRPGAARPHPG